MTLDSLKLILDSRLKWNQRVAPKQKDGVTSPLSAPTSNRKCDEFVADGATEQAHSYTMVSHLRTC